VNSGPEPPRELVVALGSLGAVAILLGALHWIYGDVQVGGIHWFNLDKERNVPTWFSGVLFALLGTAALAAHYAERRCNGAGDPCFRLPGLWLVVAAVGFGVSLDEVTVLHENLLWREVREVSAGLDAPWRYVTQWQLVYAPGLVLGLGFLATFCAGRLQINQRARATAFAGVACWVGAMFLEGIREGLRGSSAAAVAILVEEELEMLGAILLTSAIAFHVTAIAEGLTPARRRAIAAAPLFGARALEALGAISALLLISAATIYAFAGRLAESGAPLPRLVRLALEGARLAGAPEDTTLRVDDPPRAGATGSGVAGERADRPAAPSSPTRREKEAEQSVGTTPVAGDNGIWFADLERPLPQELLAGGASGIERLLEWALASPDAAAKGLPQGLRDDRAPRVVILAVGNGLTEASVYVGRGAGVLAAVADAGRQSTATSAEAGAGGSMPWRRLDVVATVNAVPPEERATARLRLRHRLEGIAFEAGSGVALSPGELVGQRLIDPAGVLDWMRVLQYLRGRQPTGGARRLRPAYRFTTVSAATDGARVVALERGLPPVRPADPAALLEAARLGGRYLTGALDADGRFTYRYRADTGTVRSGYNIVRHAGTVYSLLELYEATDDAHTLDAAERAQAFLLAQVKPAKPVKPVKSGEAAEPETPAGMGNAGSPVPPAAGGAEAGCAGVVEDGEVKLGGNALAVVALAKHAAVTGRREHLPTAVTLAEWILASQDPDGRFAIHQQTYPGGRASGFESEYYPGEAILALVRLHALVPRQGQRSWLDAAERGARWLITVRDGDAPDEALPHDHWLLYALNELHRLRPDPIFLAHTRRLARVIMASQHREPAIPEWRGGDYEPPRTTPTATRSEGLAAAYALLRDHRAGARGSATAAGTAEEDADVGRILEVLQLGAGFQLRTQLGAATAINLPQPGRALGGFHNTLTDYEIRIDYVQHNISSLLALRRILRGKPVL